MKLKKLLLSVLVAGAVSATGASATILTINPSAPNVGCVDLNGGACGPVGTNGPFQTDNAHTGYTGVLDIAAITGTTTFTEAGNIKLLDWDLGSAQLAATVTGLGRSQGGNYDIYAGFSATGTGTWLSGFNFVTTAINTLTVTIYASPSSGTAMTLGTPASGVGNTAATQGITPGSQDFILGTSTVVGSSSSFGNANLGQGNMATTSLQALMAFVPNGGPNGPLTGPGGFFTAPVPFVILIGSQAGGDALNTVWNLLPGGGVRVTTANNQGGGSLTFAALPNQVPEPGSLALLGIGLAAMGFVGFRSRARS